MPAIPPHKTATTDNAWDGPAAKANLKNDGSEAYYRSAFGWQDADGDPKTKAAYKFIHHEVSSDGDVGAANLTACSAGIAVLNGGRGGADIPDSDRRGVYNHLAKHIRDGGKEPPDLQSLDEEPETAEELTPNLVAAVYERPWAITASAMQRLLRTSPSLEALAARVGKPLDNSDSDVENHNGTAVLNVRGPLFRYRSIFTWLLGGSSIEQLALDFHAAMDDPSVKNIVLAVNSPGGQIDGINEMANMIRAGAQQKPVTAYVDGLAASGAYWLASAANRIVADETSQLGSIGVLATVMDDRGADERRGVKRYEIVSSQSPLKRTDPATDEGRQQMQEMVDGLAQLFIEKVAGFRGVAPATVARDFGRGSVMGARAAINVGMADSLGSLQELLGGQTRISPVSATRISTAAITAAALDEQELEEETEDSQINDDSNCPCPPGEDCQCEEGGESEGTEQEPDDSSIPQGGGDLIQPNADRQRIADILTCEEARGREDLARVLALETDHTVEAAKKLLKASPAGGKPAIGVLEQRMAHIPNPQIGIAGEAGMDESPAAEVARILAFVPDNRKYPQYRTSTAKN
jgi:signal peptide peptidase SppA